MSFIPIIDIIVSVQQQVKLNLNITQRTLYSQFLNITPKRHGI